MGPPAAASLAPARRVGVAATRAMGGCRARRLRPRGRCGGPWAPFRLLPYGFRSPWQPAGLGRPDGAAPGLVAIASLAGTRPGLLRAAAINAGLRRRRRWPATDRRAGRPAVGCRRPRRHGRGVPAGGARARPSRPHPGAWHPGYRRGRASWRQRTGSLRGIRLHPPPPRDLRAARIDGELTANRLLGNGSGLVGCRSAPLTGRCRDPGPHPRHVLPSRQSPPWAG
jgi:hypothetical protein